MLFYFFGFGKNDLILRVRFQVRSPGSNLYHIVDDLYCSFFRNDNLQVHCFFLLDGFPGSHNKIFNPTEIFWHLRKEVKMTFCSSADVFYPKKVRRIQTVDDHNKDNCTEIFRKLSKLNVLI